MKGTEIKAAQVIEHFLDHELGDYSHFSYNIEESEIQDEKTYIVEANICIPNNNDCYDFRVTFDYEVVGKIDEDNYEDNCKIEILHNHDAEDWQEIKTYDWQIKYFWMTILNWN